MRAPGAVTGALGAFAGDGCRAEGSDPWASVSERCFGVGSLACSAYGLMERKNKTNRQHRAQELGLSEFRPVGNMLESPSWERSREMKGKEGWRMELSGMLKGHVYKLVCAGEG